MANHTRIIDSTTPKDSEGVSAGAQQLRETRENIEERLLEEHEWGDSVTEGAADQDGTHKKVTLNNSVTPSPVTDTGVLYVKDSGGVTELYYMDENGSDIQITSGAAVSQGFLALTGTIPSTYKIAYPSGYTINNTIVNCSYMYVASDGRWTGETAYLSDSYIHLNTIDPAVNSSYVGWSYKLLISRL